MSWRQLQAESSPKTLAVTMAAYPMYIVLHVSVCGLSGVGVVYYSSLAAWLILPMIVHQR